MGDGDSAYKFIDLLLVDWDEAVRLTGETTLEMNQFAKQKYDAFDKLLNDVYGAVKLKISDKDFEKLQIQQRAWLKEVEDYNNVFEAQKFGTIGTLVKLDYEINMRSFRTLLLMMYL